MITPADRVHLERTSELAFRGWGSVHPNPMVGCVIVREGKVVAEGHHALWGGPHAEAHALLEAGDAARGATAYVSLEPCRHHGKTPPCVDALVAAGVRRVVFGASDPGDAAGGGARVLHDAGVDVDGPAWDAQRAYRENPAFVHASRSSRPWVALKLALTLDGAIAASPGTSTSITGQEAGRWVHRLRSGFDALLVGGTTARVDDPRLTVRHVPEGRTPPARLVLDSSARMDPSSRMLSEPGGGAVHVFVAAGADAGRRSSLAAAGARVHEVATGGDGLELGAVLEVCRELGVATILCEGGGRLAASLLRRDAVGRVQLLVAPSTLGPDAVPAFPGGGELPWDAFVPAGTPRALGRDTLITLDRKVA